MFTVINHLENVSRNFLSAIKMMSLESIRVEKDGRLNASHTLLAGT